MQAVRAFACISPGGRSEATPDCALSSDTLSRTHMRTATNISLGLNINLHLIDSVVQISTRIPQRTLRLHAILAVGLARPGRATNLNRPPAQLGALARSRNDRLHAEFSNGMGVVWIYCAARLDRPIGHPVAGLHEVALELFVEHPDLAQPLARGCPNPAGHQRASRKAMMFVKRGSVHVRGNQSIGIHRLLDRNAADEWWHFARHFIQPAEQDMLSGTLHAGALQEVSQPWTTEARVPYRSLLPLNSGHARVVKCATIACAFQGVGHGVRLDRPDIGKTQREWPFHFAADMKSPPSRIQRAGL